MTIERQGGFETSPLTEIQNNHYYAGAENDVDLIRGYTTEFMCDFDMSKYPFDMQRCHMVFAFQVAEEINTAL